MIKKLFIVIPAYNAGLTIEKVFARIPAAAQKRISRYVVVNDSSKDNTTEVLGGLKKQYSNLIVLTHEKNRGYGAAEKTLLNYAVARQAEVAILLHSDGQYSPEKLLEILKPFDDGSADLVQGSRMLGGGALKGGMPLYKYISNKCLTALENRAFSMKMAEYHSGYMAYSRKFLLEVPFNKLSDSFDFDLEMIVMAKIKGIRIKEIPIPTIYGEEISYLNPIKYGLHVLSVVKDYKKGKYHLLIEEMKTSIV
jgi:glycosyltransferase involved in cell wall biosynthesis